MNGKIKFHKHLLLVQQKWAKKHLFNSNGKRKKIRKFRAKWCDR